MDSLGGMLTKGLLGNPILAQFNLFFFSIVITTPDPPNTGGGGSTWAGTSSRSTEREEDQVRNITIAVKFKTKEFVKTYELTEKKLSVTINILNIVSRTVNKLRNISLLFKKNRD